MLKRMDQRKKKILELIENGVEDDTVDFKQRYYHDSKKYDLIKDIISFANASSLEDRYIIIGVNDETRETVDVSDEQFPDISDINQLIRTYCDPFIDIELERMVVDEKQIVAIIIKNNNLQKPYVVAKDYSYKGKIYLHAGDIFIRKSANNFRALRSDIEEIYKTRLVVEIISCDNKIEIGTVEIARLKQNYVCVPIRLINSTDNAFVFSKATVKWIYPNSSTGSSVLYIEESRKQFKQSLEPLETSPFVLSAKTQTQKVLYSKVSDGFCKVIRQNEMVKQDLKIEISLFDARGTEYKTNFTVDKVVWD